MNRLSAPLLILLCGIGVSSNCSAQNQTQVEHYNVAFDLAPRGDKIVFSAADGDLYLLNLQSLRVSRLTRTKEQESTPEFSPDGLSIVYSASTDGDDASHIFIRSLNGKTVRQLTKSKAASDVQPSFSADGSRIAFSRAGRHRPYSMGGWTWDNYDICTMKSYGTQMSRLTRQNYYSAGSARFLDGKTVLYSADVSKKAKGYDLISRLFTVDAKGLQSSRVLASQIPRKAVDSSAVALGSSPNVSRDGKRIVFLSDQAGAFAYDFYVMDTKGGNITPLNVTRVSRYNQNAVFTPDGKSILFLAGTEANASSRPIFSLWRVGISGQKPVRVADSGLFTSPSTWKAKK